MGLIIYLRVNSNISFDYVLLIKVLISFWHWQGLYEAMQCLSLFGFWLHWWFKWMGDDMWKGVIVLLFSIFHLIINDMALGLGHEIIDISCDDYSYKHTVGI